MNPILQRDGAAAFVHMTLFLQRQTALKGHPIVTRIDGSGAEMRHAPSTEQLGGGVMPQALQGDLVRSAAALWLEAAAPAGVARKITGMRVAFEAQSGAELVVTVDGSAVTWQPGEHEVLIEARTGGNAGMLQFTGAVKVLIGG